MARPSIYEDKIKPKLKYIPSLIDAGWSNLDIAKLLDISEDTLYQYKKDKKEFSECFEKKLDIVKEVENTYVNRLTGKYRATREIFERDKDMNSPTYGTMVLARVEKYEIPLNDGAYKHYLSTCMPDKWREKVDEGDASDALNKIVNAFKGVGNEQTSKE